MKKQIIWLIVGILLTILLFSIPGLTFGSNETNVVKIYIDQSSSTKMELTYLIKQTFNTESRGIFLALPKNQDGVWTEYKVKSVQKTSKLDLKYSNNPILPVDQNFTQEDYQFIHEWDQLRVRVGNKNRILENGAYLYELKIEADYNPNLSYNFDLLKDWQDPVDKLEVIQNQQNLCAKNLNCSSKLTTINFNSNQPKPNFGSAVLFSTLPYLLILIVLTPIIFLSWWVFAKDLYPIISPRSPEFEPPKNILPWQAMFLLNSSKVNVKNTLLAYILWLNNGKIIELKPDSNAKDQTTDMTIVIKKDLPNVLPEIFNKAVNLISTGGMKNGIYASKINESSQPLLFKKISQDLAPLYKQKPLGSGSISAIAIVSGFGLFFFNGFFFGILKDTFLVGESYFPLAIFALILIWLGLVLVLIFWTKLSRQGADLKNQISRYRYYLNYVEKYKLDFSNNPDDGVQYYLKSVAFAAAFGLLAKFQSYFGNIFPKNEQIQNGNLLSSSYNSVIFYTPPSSSNSSFGGGGSSGGFSGGGGSW